jgi:ribose 5-phosphate isomerase B
MKIALASDHGGYELKEELKTYIEKSSKFEVNDFGTDSEESVDYPDFAHKVANEVENGKADFGVLVCGSGIGMSMAANRHKGVRAVVLHDKYDAEMSRLHNNANVACLGGRVTPVERAKELLGIFFETAFEGDRHVRRIQKIENK